MGILRRVTAIRLLGLVILASCGPTFGDETALPSARISAAHKQQYADLAVQWMQDYLRIDTTNPPGNEVKAIAFFKKILDQEGIENRVFEYAPGRGDLWARLPHTTPEAKRPIVLLNHMDVVTSDPAHWKVPPFSGDIKDGYIWGRGAQDMKDEGLAQLVVMVMLKREKVPLDRDVVLSGRFRRRSRRYRHRLVHQPSAGFAGECRVPD